MKDIKKLLKESRSSVLPDNKVKQQIKNDLNIDNRAQSTVVAYNNGTTSSSTTNNTKRRNQAIAIVAVILTIFAILLPIMLSSTGGDNPIIGDNGKFDDIVTTGDFYAYGAASIGSLLTTSTGTSTSSKVSMSVSDMSVVATNGKANSNIQLLNSGLTDSQISLVNSYMPLVEELLGEGKITYKESQSQVGGFEYFMTIWYKDALGQDVQYTMYYNKELLSTETEGDEQESNYSIVGELHIDSAVYEVEGTSQTETETGEEESEMRFRAYTAEDKRSYIEVEQSTESENEDNEVENETEYLYTVVEQGVRVRRISASYEQENNQIELVLNIEERDGTKNRLVFKNASKDGQYVFNVNARLDGDSVSFVVRITQSADGNSIYSYEALDGTHWGEGDRYDDNDDDDDDDDRHDHDDDHRD